MLLLLLLLLGGAPRSRQEQQPPPTLRATAAKQHGTLRGLDSQTARPLALGAVLAWNLLLSAYIAAWSFTPPPRFCFVCAASARLLLRGTSRPLYKAPGPRYAKPTLAPIPLAHAAASPHGPIHCFLRPGTGQHRAARLGHRRCRCEHSAALKPCRRRCPPARARPPAASPRRRAAARARAPRRRAAWRPPWAPRPRGRGLHASGSPRRSPPPPG